MRKLYHPLGRFHDEQGTFDVLMTRGEANIMMEYQDGTPTVKRLARQLAEEAAKLKRRLDHIVNEFKANKYHMFGTGRYAFQNMASTTRLIVGVAHPPEQEYKRVKLYDDSVRARFLQSLDNAT